MGPYLWRRPGMKSGMTRAKWKLLFAILLVLAGLAMAACFGSYLHSRNRMANEGFYQDRAARPGKSNVVVGIASVMRKPIDLPLWFRHHRNVLGVQRFYIRLEDAGEVSLEEEFLKLSPLTQGAVRYELGHSDFKERDNFKSLQQRQIEFVNRSLQHAKDDGVDVLFHIDSDDLLDGSLEFLKSIPENVKCLHIENVEALYEESNATKQPGCFSATKFIRCAAADAEPGNNAQCVSYINGKGAAIVSAVPDVQLDGPHRFSYRGSVDGADFVFKVPQDTLRVLHFDSCSFASWVEKFHNLSGHSPTPEDKIPFPYYTESIEAAKQAYAVYVRHKFKDAKGFVQGTVLERP